MGAPKTLPADFFEKTNKGAPDKLPANFFTTKETTTPAAEPPTPSIEEEVKTTGPLTRFGKNLVETALPSTTLEDYWKGPGYAVAHPIEAAKLLGGAMLENQGVPWKKAKKNISYAIEAIKRGDVSSFSIYLDGAMSEATSGSIPLIGPLMSNAGERLGKGDVAGALGILTGIIAPYKVGKFVKGKVAGAGAGLERLNIRPTLGETTGSPMVKALEPVVSRVPGARATTEKFLAERQQQVGSAATREAAKFSPMPRRELPGKIQTAATEALAGTQRAEVQKTAGALRAEGIERIPTEVAESKTVEAVRGNRNALREIESAAWEKLSQDADAAGVKVSPEALDKVAMSLSSLERSAREVIIQSVPSDVLQMISRSSERASQVMKQIAKQLGFDSVEDLTGAASYEGFASTASELSAQKPVSFSVMKKARTGVGRALDRAKTRRLSTGQGGTEIYYLSKIYGTITKSLEDSLKANAPSSSRWYRGVMAGTPESGDRFYTTEREVAGDFAAPARAGGKEGKILEATPRELPRNVFRATDKASLAEELGIAEKYKDPTISRAFDEEAKSILQARGFDGIEYSEGTFGAGELHAFEGGARITTLSDMFDTANALSRELHGTFDRPRFIRNMIFSDPQRVIGAIVRSSTRPQDWVNLRRALEGNPEAMATAKGGVVDAILSKAEMQKGGVVGAKFETRIDYARALDSLDPVSHPGIDKFLGSEYHGKLTRTLKQLQAAEASPEAQHFRSFLSKFANTDEPKRALWRIGNSIELANQAAEMVKSTPGIADAMAGGIFWEAIDRSLIDGKFIDSVRLADNLHRIAPSIEKISGPIKAQRVISFASDLETMSIPTSLFERSFGPAPAMLTAGQAYEAGRVFFDLATGRWRQAAWGVGAISSPALFTKIVTSPRSVALAKAFRKARIPVNVKVLGARESVLLPKKREEDLGAVPIRGSFQNPNPPPNP